MKKLLYSIFFLSLTISAQDFILPMGYNEPWTGKLLFNSEGGYNTGGNHDWEQLYEAQSGDVYTITMPTACYEANYGKVQFKTPITIHADHSYRFNLSFQSNKRISDVEIALCENENDEIYLLNATTSLSAGGKKTFSRTNLTGIDIEDAKIALAFPTTEDDVTITLSAISIYDSTEGKELWLRAFANGWNCPAFRAVSKGLRSRW